MTLTQYVIAVGSLVGAAIVAALILAVLLLRSDPYEIEEDEEYGNQS